MLQKSSAHSKLFNFTNLAKDTINTDSSFRFENQALLKIRRYVPSVQRPPPRIALCAFTFFSNRACLCRMLSSTPQTLLSVHCCWRDALPITPLTITTKKVHTTKKTKFCMFSAHKICFRANEQLSHPTRLLIPR